MPDVNADNKRRRVVSSYFSVYKITIKLKLFCPLQTDLSAYFYCSLRAGTYLNSKEVLIYILILSNILLELKLKSKWKKFD